MPGPSKPDRGERLPGAKVAPQSWPATRLDSAESLDPGIEAARDLARELRGRRGRRLHDDLVEVVFQPAAANLFIGLLVAIAVVVASRQYLPALSTGLWLALVAALTLARLGIVRSHRRQASRHSSRMWLRLFIGGVWLSGLTWGIYGCFLMPLDPPQHQLLGFLALIGLSAVSANALSPLRWSAAHFAAPAVLPTSARLLLSGDPVNTALALFALLFVFGLMWVTVAQQKAIRQSLSYRHENHHLLDELANVNNGLLAQIEAREIVDRELAKRDAILESVSTAAERLLQSNVALHEPEQILGQLARATGVPRVSLSVLEEPVPDRTATAPGAPAAEPSRYHEWLAPLAALPRRDAGPVPSASKRWNDLLGQRSLITQLASRSRGSESEWMTQHGIGSLALLPVFSGERLWAVLSLEDGGERLWTKPELEALTTACEMLGAAALRSETERALESTDRRYRLLAENTRDLITIHDLEGRFLYVSPSLQELTTMEADTIVGQEPERFLPASLLATLKEELFMPAVRGETITHVFSLRLPGGRLRWFETTAQPVHESESGDVQFVLAASRDITSRREAEQQLFREKELAQVTLKSIGDGVITTDQKGRVQFLNTAAEQLTGRRSDESRGLRLADFFDNSRTDDAIAIVSMIEHAQLQDSMIRSNESIHLTTAQGEERALDLSASPIHDPDGVILGTVVVLRDVTRAERLSAQLTYQATHDSLTGLLNRREFENRLISLFSVVRTAEVSGAPRPQHALCYLDLDQFKVVNDTCGHIAGDELLRQVAAVLTSRVRKTDTVARLGGDEFGILLHDCPIDKALEMSEDLCQRLTEHRFSWDQQIFRLGTSIGVVEITGAARHVAELLSSADAACYAAKEQGRGRVHQFRPDDLQMTHRSGQMRWIGRIHSALDEDRLYLRYQPIYEPREDPTGHRRIELLLSMVDENGEVIPPGSFIPAAERFNAMNQLDRWVVQTALESLAPHWRDPSRPGRVETCYINVSGTSIANESFLGFLQEQIQEYNVPPGTLCFELTETAAISNLAEAIQFMDVLHEAGCRFALDDFGSGVSSFGYLRSLPVDFLKIDGTFVRDLHRDPVNRAIVESIRKVAEQLDLQTIAEYVENQETLEILIDMGVDLVQGFHLAKPKPLRDLVSELRPASRPAAEPEPSTAGP